VIIYYRRFGTTYRCHLQGSRILTPEDRSSLLILRKLVESFGGSVYSKYFGNASSLSAHTYMYEHASNGDKKSEIRVRMTDEFLSAVLRIAIPTLTRGVGMLVTSHNQHHLSH